MTNNLILASGSAIRAEMLTNAGLDFQTKKPRVDEETIKLSLLHEGATARDIADTLAELKAQKVSNNSPGALVIGCDQVLELAGNTFDKPKDQAEAEQHLGLFSDSVHRLFSACVIYEDGKPIWRHVGVARMHVHPLSSEYIKDYVQRNWDEIRHCVGCYQLEGEGARLFRRIEGDNFTVLGLPLLELLSYLVMRGTLVR